MGISTIVEFLGKKGYEIDSNPNSKLDADLYDLLEEEYSLDLNVKKESEKLTLKNLRERQESLTLEDVKETAEQEEGEELIITDHTGGTSDAAPVAEKEEAAPAEEAVAKEEKPPAEPEKKTKAKKVEKEPEKEAEPEVAEGGPRVVGKIDLDSMNQKTRPGKKTKAKAKEKEAGKEEVKEAEEKVTAEAEAVAPETAEKEAEKEAAKAEAAAPEAESPETAEEVGEEAEESPAEEKAKDETNLIPTRVEKLTGPTVVGKIELPKKKEQKKKPVASSTDDQSLDQKKKRKRIKKETGPVDIGKQKAGAAREKSGKKRKRAARPEVNEEDVQKQIKDTLAKLTSKGSKSKASKYRREKRDAVQAKLQEETEQQEQRQNVLQVTEFVSVSELASMMSVPPTEVIQTCMNLGLFVSINQRLDAETMALVADEFDYKVEFVSVDVVASIQDDEDDPEDLIPRPPIVTVMGHVDHGKTKLLDVVRHANVVAGEAGGITQHIGAYGVELEDGRKITFLDTPGHEAFTAMRARGAQITDVAIIVVAADDGVKPQTVEAINHAAAAGVPIVFAINKIDLQTANPEKIKEELANMNYMVEDWGGKYQSQEISAKGNKNIVDLLVIVMVLADLLELKANPEMAAWGKIIF